MNSTCLVLLCLVATVASSSDVEMPEVNRRIMGGEAVDSSVSPFIVGIRDKGSPRGGRFFCTGTIIHPNWILTAASCTESNRNGLIEDDNQFEVVLSTA